MRIALQHPIAKAGVLLAALLPAGLFIYSAGKEYVASYLAGKPDIASMERAIRLEPGDAEYHSQRGRYFWLMQRSFDQAEASYREAVARNPHQSRYWLDLAGIYQLLGNETEQRNALEHAIAADPTTPQVAWEAANLYVVEGETDKALQEYRVVLEYDPFLPSWALDACWRIKPDIDALLRDVIPPVTSVQVGFLELMASKKQTDAAAKVWAQIVRLQRPVEKRYVFDYIRYLISQEQVDQARMVWQQAGSLSGLSAYQPSSENLVVNGDFGLDVLNGGFDWTYQMTPDVSLSIDPTQTHSGNHSLSLVFDSRGLNDAGILQMIPVQPNTSYEFSAYFKSEDMLGAGGPQFMIQDFYKGTTYYSSDNLTDADFWKRVSGDFTTDASTKLLVLHMQRVPQGRAIKGKLWIDGVHLAPKAQG